MGIPCYAGRMSQRVPVGSVERMCTCCTAAHCGVSNGMGCRAPLRLQLRRAVVHLCSTFSACARPRGAYRPESS